jgi:cell division septation protein DedD
MKKHKSKLQRFGYRQYFVPLLFVGGFALIGSLLLLIGFAASPDPIGFADSCYLDGTTTVVRGWAHDDSAGSGPDPAVQITVAGKTAAVPTSIANYRQAEIDAALSSNGYTPASVYGFEARFTGLNKGTAPVISGTILNVGPGANAPLGINTFNQGAAPGGSIFQQGNVVPDSCLASVPSPAPAAPKSTPTPTTKKRATTPSPAPASPTPTPPAPTTQSQATYIVTLNFFNNSKEATDVKAALQELNVTATTDKNNQVVFNDVPPGTYTASFNYQGKNYSYTLEVPPSQTGQATASADGKTLSYTIDLAHLPVAAQPQHTASAQQPAKGGIRIGKLIALFTGLLFMGGVLAVVILFIRRRRSRRKSSHDDILSAPYKPPTVVTPSSHTPPPHDPHLHTGVSLKEMVLESMRKETANRHDDHPKQ